MNGGRSEEGGKTVQRNVNEPEEIILVQKVLYQYICILNLLDYLFHSFVFVGAITPPLFSHNLVLWLSCQ
jgi:hypothetical protein